MWSRRSFWKPDAGKARDLARPVAQIYTGLPNYRNNWLRMGLEESDFENGGSDKFIDTTFAWGSVSRSAGEFRNTLMPAHPTSAFSR